MDDDYDDRPWDTGDVVDDDVNIIIIYYNISYYKVASHV